MSDYPRFPKIPRYNRNIVVTEKIDGTNGLIAIQPWGGESEYIQEDWHPVSVDTGHFLVRAGSRTRWITPSDDNFGFAAWVRDHAAELAATLGAGLHYGEWWGQGIQRRYGLTDRRFSLFNTSRWNGGVTVVPGLHVVPVLYVGPATIDLGSYQYAIVDIEMDKLRVHGSQAAPAWPRPEGVVIFHTAAHAYFKATLDGDEGGCKSDYVLTG